MALSVLSQASAFNPGSDLWVMPDLEKSNWTAKLDWYLNFQICKSSRHVSPKLPLFIKEVIAETGLEKNFIPSSPKQPLMISSAELLPNKWVVIIPWDKDMAQWSSQSYEIWQKLGEPSLRIFLPPGQNTGGLQSAWHSRESFQDFTVVLD